MRRGTSQSPARTAHQRILAAKKEGQWQEALNIIAEMREQGHSLGTFSYNAAIDACGKAKQVVRALELFDELVAAGNVRAACFIGFHSLFFRFRRRRDLKAVLRLSLLSCCDWRRCRTR